MQPCIPVIIPSLPSFFLPSSFHGSSVTPSFNRTAQSFCACWVPTRWATSCPVADIITPTHNSVPYIINRNLQTPFLCQITHWYVFCTCIMWPWKLMVQTSGRIPYTQNSSLFQQIAFCLVLSPFIKKKFIECISWWIGIEIVYGKIKSFT